MTRSSALKWIGGAAGAIVVAAMLGPIVTTASASSSDASLQGAAPAHASATVTTAVRPVVVRLTAKQARAAVLTQVPKARVIAVRASQHGGYKAFAVKVERTDGSTLIGYVDSASGVVFDWSHPTAPAVQQSSNPSSNTGNQADDETSADNQDDADNASDDDQYDDDQVSQNDDHEDSGGGQHGDDQDSQNDDGDNSQNDD